MKRLHLLILKSYIGPLILTFFIVIFLLLMQFLWKYIDDLVGKGLEWYIIARLLFYTSISFVPMALPLAILLSSIMTYGNFGENYELVAMKSSGISLLRIMKPLIILSGLICIAAFYFSNNILPYTNLKMKALLYDIRKKRPELNIPVGIFYNGIEGYSIKVERKNPDTKMMYNIMVYDHSSGSGNRKVTVADSGFINISSDTSYMLITVFNGYNYIEIEEHNVRYNQRSYPHRCDKFKKETLLIKLTGFDFTRTSESLFRHHYSMLNLKQLEFTIDSLQKDFSQRKQEFSDNMLRLKYYRTEPEKIKDSCLINYDTLSPVNVRKIVLDMKFPLKSKIIDRALNYARSAKRFAEVNKDSFNAKKKWINKHKIQWHKKFTLSFACLILFFIGAPLGAIIRKGGLGMPVVVSVLFFIFYYVIDISGEKFVVQGILPAWQGVWLSSAILLPIGIFLTYKATNDSIILNIETYITFFKKIFNIKKWS